jgi:hypothetical protein
MLWAAMMVSILDDKMAKASCYCFVAALLAFIGVIHSPLADETVGFPWAVLASIDKPFLEAVKVQSPYHWASGYLICAGLLLVLSKYGKAADEESAPGEEFQSNASGKI